MSWRTFRPHISQSRALFNQDLFHANREDFIQNYCGVMNNKQYLLQDKLEKREKGFQISGLQSVNLKEYNALYDPNMRHFFESKHNQSLLYRTGQIDSHGRVIDYEKNKSKLHILEREFKEAERVEEKRQQEEKEMRHRVQRKRFNELERAKKAEILERLKAERDLSNEIISTLKLSATGGFDAKASLTKKSSASSSRQSREGFFITDGQK